MESSSSCTKQCIASLVSLSLHFALGICQGFSAVLIPQLESDGSSIKVTNVESSWIASIPSISMPLSALFIGVLMESFGRKRVIQLAFVPLICGWALIWQSKSISTLYVGRFATGLAIGMDPAAVVYIAEINTPQYRALLLSLTGPIKLFGILVAYMFAHYLHWKSASLIFMVFSGLSWVCFFFIPESPVWLVSRDRINAASESLRRLRGSDDDAVQTELEELLEHMSMSKGKDVDDREFERLSVAQKIRVTKAWKPYLVLTCFFLLEQLSGINIVFSYALDFYAEFGLPVSNFVLSVAYVLLCLGGSFIFTIVVERINRRTLSAVTAGVACVSCAMTAAYVYSFDGRIEKPVYWLPLVCAWTWVISVAAGYGSMPWLMAGELFPTRVRGLMTSVLWVNVYVYSFVAVKMYPLILPYLKIYGVLSVFSVGAFLAVIFSLRILPETKGKTLIEIEKSW